MAHTVGRMLGNALCEVLGLSPDVVRNIEIKADVSEPSLAVIYRYIEDTEVPQVAEIMAKYALVPKRATRREIDRQEINVDEPTGRGSVDTTGVGSENKTYGIHAVNAPGPYYYRGKPWSPPACPSCGIDGENIEAEDTSRFYVCTNPDCILKSWTLV